MGETHVLRAEWTEIYIYPGTFNASWSVSLIFFSSLNRFVSCMALKSSFSRKTNHRALVRFVMPYFRWIGSPRVSAKLSVLYARDGEKGSTWLLDKNTLASRVIDREAGWL